MPSSRRTRRARGGAPLEEIPGASRVPLARRLPWTPVVVSLLVLLAAAFAVSPIRDAVSLGDVAEASLSLPPGYVAIAPLSDVLDTLSLLGVAQHIAFLVWLIGLYAAWRVWRRRVIARAPGARSIVDPRLARRVLREVAFALAFLFAIVLVYAAVAVLPRPMAALAVSGTYRSDVVTIDFHSHTKYSHDGRPGWSAEDVRRWHRDAGYDVAYISDHRSFQGAQEGVRNNPAAAGQGTVLLPALEAFYRGEHVNLLSAGSTYQGLWTANLRDIDSSALALASGISGRAPVLVETVPGHLDRVPAAGPRGPGVRAIELVDGSPRGLTQSRRDRGFILRIADSLNLAIVAGTDNHGWGRTAPAWTLMAVAGWRAASDEDLAGEIERQLREVGAQSTKVIERRVADPGNNDLALVVTLPAVLWRMLTTLSPLERGAWLVWTWVLWLAVREVRNRRARARLRIA